ncbi:MAG TPA: ABC transporter permease subunit [Anaerolineae bacterium]|nr:ABC transporter permease subunit [Anaerolineae bacterium]
MSQEHIQVITSSNIPLWRDERIIKGIVQVISAIAVIGFVAFAIGNVINAAHERGLSLGYDFINQSAGFPLAESVIPYDESKSFGYAFLVGVLNTLRAALVGIVAATLLGTLAALARLSTNWLVNKIASVYIETVRNIPLLVQLFIWYFAVFQGLPDVQESIRWPGPIFLSKRGIYMPAPVPTGTFGAWMGFVIVGLVLAIVLRIVLGRYQLQTGRTTYPVATAFAVFFGLPLLGWFIVGQSPLTVDLPVMGKFNFTGGLRLTIEYAALLTGLVIYTGAFIAEVVRAGILAVNRGQFEAARALGLSNMQVLRLVVFPQAMRVIIPPLISQYLNLTKNSSLAVAVGYPDLFYVGRTIINQAGRAVPVFLMVMGVYLFTSLTTSVLMNFYNRRVQLVER